MISLEDGKILVKLTRLSIETYFSGRVINLHESDKFTEKRGVFVTLNKFGHLRGCIGFPEPIHELNRAIIEAARAAAFDDPRFPEVTAKEFEDISIELTVLTKPELLEVEKPEEYLDKISLGKHGLIIRSILGSGLLLPQVFIEYDSTPKEALEMTCQKAGLDANAWRNLQNKIFIFSGQIFEELEPNGKVIIKKV